jgi:hypothetical protein
VIQLTEHHEIQRYMDTQTGKMLFFCRECSYAEEREIDTLEKTWKRPGAEGVAHSGGYGIGISVSGSKEKPLEAE